MKKSIQRIGVFTSGGDAPGMNAAIRAVVRSCHYYQLDVYGIYKGYQGLIEDDFIDLKVRSVNHILAKGGTILKSARSIEFKTKEGRAKAYENLKERGIDALVAIGGDGTFTGAKVFYEEYNFPIIGIPGTIDNDLYGTDYTIGYDTASNTAVEAIDKIRDTASSHNRLFFVEVMGRDAGFLALRSAISTGAIEVMLPETNISIDELIKTLQTGQKRQKTSSIIVVGEGNTNGGAVELAKQVNEKYNEYDTRVTILGHIQRGGSPSVLDRVLASKLGVAAVEALIEGKYNMMIGSNDTELVYTPFEEAITKRKEINHHLLRITKILSI